jgi:lipopolysaccharide/colanic/teichoic acid biosynthesis glycosyltransferase
MKRIFDLVLALSGLILFSPLLLVVMFLVWYQDKASPLYIAPRVGRDGHIFNMIKLRSMVKNADQIGSSSTSSNDRRITPIGQFIRTYKLDELMQLWNVVCGDMSLVGPRPQVQSGVDEYTKEELRLLSVQPGITDFSSIVFSDEGEILKNYTDPDTAYNELIRPGKSMLGLFYVDQNNLVIDLYLIVITIFAIFSKERALSWLTSLLGKMQAKPELIAIASRKFPLIKMDLP